MTPRFVVWCSIQLSYERLPFPDKETRANHHGDEARMGHSYRLPPPFGKSCERTG